MPPVSLRLGPAADRVFESLRREIEDGALPLHARLPAERELCGRFGVNRGTLRRALARLESEGRIATRRGSGSHVVAAWPRRDCVNIISLMCGGNVETLPDITRQALEHGCTLGIYSQFQVKWDRDLELLFLRRVRQQRHLGLLAACAPDAPENQRLLAELAASGTRVIHTEPHGLDAPALDHLMPDYQRAGYAATVQLLMSGFRRIIFITMKHSGPSIHLCERGFHAALRDQGIGTGAPRLIAADPAHGTVHHMAPYYLQPQARQSWDQLMAAIDGPTGFVVPGDGRAGQAIDALRAAGRPHDRVICVDLGPNWQPIPLPPMDTFTFDRATLYRRALTHVTATHPTELRELLSPHYRPASA